MKISIAKTIADAINRNLDSDIMKDYCEDLQIKEREGEKKYVTKRVSRLST